MLHLSGISHHRKVRVWTIWISNIGPARKDGDKFIGVGGQTVQEVTDKPLSLDTPTRLRWKLA